MNAPEHRDFVYFVHSPNPGAVEKNWQVTVASLSLSNLPLFLFSCSPYSSRREQWNLSNAKAVYVLGVGENNKKSGEESGEILSYFWAVVGKRGTSQTESALGKMKRKSPEGCSV